MTKNRSFQIILDPIENCSAESFVQLEVVQFEALLYYKLPTKNQNFSKILFACFHLKSEASKRYTEHISICSIKDSEKFSSIPSVLVEQDKRFLLRVKLYSITNERQLNNSH